MGLDLEACPHLALGTLDSTNEEALRRLERGELPVPCLLTARKQTDGRGRHRGRKWVSEAGNLFATLVLEQNAAPPPSCLSLLAACAVYRAARHFVDPAVVLSLKWPNDVLLCDQKVAGILLETGAKGTLLIGMGVNLVSAPAVSILHRASTCLQAWSSARAVTREAYLPVLLAAFSALFSLWKTQGIPAIIAEWLGNSQDVGRPLILRMGQEEIRGVFESLNAEGFLVLRLPDGQSKIVASGEVQ